MIDLKVPGAILFVASISAHSTNYPQPQAAYNASKAALISLKSSLAAEWARYGIRVNTISPGYMDTILNEGDGLEEARRTWLERNPTGRMGNPEELAGPVVLLCSEAGSYITGADLIVCVLWTHSFVTPNPLTSKFAKTFWEYIECWVVFSFSQSVINLKFTSRRKAADFKSTKD